jgi:hypothetical protein
MTLKPLTLDQYFHKIVNQPETKETTMFEYLKNKWQELTTTKYEFVEQDVRLHEDGYWAFEMYTPEYTCDGELEPEQHSVLLEPHEGTWMEVLDQVLDVMGKHYGYSIKEQVYYSVHYPLNEVDEKTGKPYAGYGRCLNDELLQQLLLAYPEIYDAVPFGGQATKGIFE